MGKFSVSEEQAVIRTMEIKLTDKGIDELGEIFGALPTSEEDMPEPDEFDEVYEVDLK